MVANRRTRVVIGGLLAAVLVVVPAGCAGVSRSGSDQPGVPLPPKAVGPVPLGQRISIARASDQDIAATLRANGVEDPERWSEVVSDHKPYPPDPSLTKLRQVLTEERADPVTVATVTEVLRP